MDSGERVGGGWWWRRRRWRCRRGWGWRGGDAGGDGGGGHGGDDGGRGGGGRGDDSDDSTCMGRRAPIPLAAPNTHCGIEGGYGTHDNSARDGVRGFEGSGVRGFEGSDPGPHPEGIIGPSGLVTSKRSSPEAYS